MFYKSRSVAAKIGSGCASVLKTNWSCGRTDGGPKRRYRYLSVSARKKLSEQRDRVSTGQGGEGVERHA